MATSASTHPGHASPDRRTNPLAVIALWIPIFAIGMVIHEALHAIAVVLLGSHPFLVLRPWPLALFPFTITGIHVQPLPPLDPTRQFLDNLVGPGGAAILFGLIALKLRRGVIRSATIATVLGLMFYAVVESTDVLLDGRLDPGFLTAPEFNYGVPFLIALAVAGVAANSHSQLEGR